jgi:N-acetylmuramoyl-L-alanine amidase
MAGTALAVRVAIAVAMLLAVSAPALAQSARQRFEAALDRDERVRAELTAAAAPAEVMREVTRVVTAFEAIVRRYPTSGYSDNALWQAAELAAAAYGKFGRTEDQQRAIRFYRWLVKEYPSSSFVKRANQQVAAINTPRVAAPAARAAAPTPPPATPPATVPTVTSPATPSAADVASEAAASAGEPVTLTAIERTVLPNAVRVTIALDREVKYHQERLEGPARLFFDLKGVQPSAALMDKVLTYPSDVIGKIRVGRHPDDTVRVVLDLEAVSRYSVFTLYGPFRLVIDAERASTAASGMATPPAPSSIAAPSPATAALATPATPAAPPPPAASSTATAAAAAAVATPAAAAPADKDTPAAPSPPSPTTATANGSGGFSMARQLGLGVARIVIDPGHGGHDPGVSGKGLSEAALVLDIALRLEKLLADEPGLEVVLTRRTNTYIALEERTAIANRHNADLFLSIHANASRNVAAKGIETYYLSFASSPEAEAVAARENSASARDMHQLPDIIRAIALNNKLDESRDLAGMVQESLVTGLRKTNKEVRSRGVKKAPFVVLIGAEMPSVLAEISFVSNKQELALLKTAGYKQKIAESLHGAVLRYRRSLKGQSTMTEQER